MLNKFMDLLPIVSCQEATRLASLSMERKLTFKENIDLKLHFMVCSLCAQFDQQIKGLRTMLRNYQPHHEKTLPQSVKEQLKQSLK